MKKLFVPLATLLLMAGASLAQEPAASAHVVLTAENLTWGDVPPFLPKGAKVAVLSGDPSKPGIFVIRLMMPAGYRVAPHWHPTDEHVTILDGTAAVGMGNTIDEAKATTLGAGAYALLPAKMAHYAMAKTAVTLQVTGQGPFTLTYVNPADDPSKK